MDEHPPPLNDPARSASSLSPLAARFLSSPRRTPTAARSASSQSSPYSPYGMSLAYIDSDGGSAALDALADVASDAEPNLIGCVECQQRPARRRRARPGGAVRKA
mmetsp:Transcript_30198/g.64104  ORF Transcript_30198/g.64104 Transcript_30198/m.64104 type:complete len:105 (-) Transcript_30198:799-1113(-)